MSEATKAPVMGQVTNKADYLWKPGPAFMHNGRTVDLRTITDATARALANDPICKFLQWKDPKKRHPNQVQGFTEDDMTVDPASKVVAPAAPESKEAASTAPAGDASAANADVSGGKKAGGK